MNEMLVPGGLRSLQRISFTLTLLPPHASHDILLLVMRITVNYGYYDLELADDIHL